MSTPTGDGVVLCSTGDDVNVSELDGADVAGAVVDTLAWRSDSPPLQPAAAAPMRRAPTMMFRTRDTGARYSACKPRDVGSIVLIVEGCPSWLKARAVGFGFEPHATDLTVGSTRW